MKKYTDHERNRIITHHDDGTITHEILEVGPTIDSRTALEKEIDELFRLHGFAIIPFLTVGIMSAGFFFIMLITVAIKWIVTGTPL